MENEMNALLRLLSLPKKRKPIPLPPRKREAQWKMGTEESNARIVAALEGVEAQMRWANTLAWMRHEQRAMAQESQRKERLE